MDNHHLSDPEWSRLPGRLALLVVLLALPGAVGAVGLGWVVRRLWR